MSALPSAAQVTLDRAETAGSLCERYRSSILAYCWSRLGSREEAEDAAQTTFLNAFQALQRGVVPQYESAWLFAIADNVCRVRRRAAGRRSRVEFARDVQTLEETTAAPQSDSDELLGLAEALARLPERQRHALLLREWHGLSYEEIARELDVSHAAVETLLFRARRSLAQDLSGALEARPKRRLRTLDIASLLSALKSALGFGGGAALKTAVAVSALATATATIAVGVPGRGTPDRPERAPAPVRATGSSASGQDAGTVPAAGLGAQQTRGPIVAGTAASPSWLTAPLLERVQLDGPGRSADRPGGGPAADGPPSGDPRAEGGGAAPPSETAPRGADPGSSSPTSPIPAAQENGEQGPTPLSGPGLPNVPDVPAPPPPPLPDVPPAPQLPQVPPAPPVPPVPLSPPLPEVPPAPPLPELPPVPPPAIPPPPQLPPLPPVTVPPPPIPLPPPPAVPPPPISVPPVPPVPPISAPPPPPVPPVPPVPPLP